MKKRILTVITVIMCSTIISACNTTAPKKINDDVKKEAVEKSVERKNIVKKDVSNNEEQVNYEKTLRGESIANSLVMEKGIEDASVAVINDEAIVAVVLSKNEKLSNKRKEDIKKIVNSFDNSIRKVYITENKETFFNVDEVAQSIMKKNYSEDIKRKFEDIKSNLNVENI